MSVRTVVAAALEAEGLTPAAARVVAGRLPDLDGGGVQELIVAAARAMTDAGLAPRPLQVRVFARAFGVALGGGGGGGMIVTPQCPWCGATGGGHGGFCPGPYLAAGPGPYLD